MRLFVPLSRVFRSIEASIHLRNFYSLHNDLNEISQPFFMTATACDDCNDMSFEIARVLIPNFRASLKNCNTLPPLPEEKMWWAFSSWLGCRQLAYDLHSHLVWIFEVMDTATLDYPVLILSCSYDWRSVDSLFGNYIHYSATPFSIWSNLWLLWISTGLQQNA